MKYQDTKKKKRNLWNQCFNFDLSIIIIILTTSKCFSESLFFIHCFAFIYRHFIEGALTREYLHNIWLKPKYFFSYVLCKYLCKDISLLHKDLFIYNAILIQYMIWNNKKKQRKHVGFSQWSFSSIKSTILPGRLISNRLLIDRCIYVHKYIQ